MSAVLFETASTCPVMRASKEEAFSGSLSTQRLEPVCWQGVSMPTRYIPILAQVLSPAHGECVVLQQPCERLSQYCTACHQSSCWCDTLQHTGGSAIMERVGKARACLLCMTERWSSTKLLSMPHLLRLCRELCMLCCAALTVT
jgi:hypothetical protein